MQANNKDKFLSTDFGFQEFHVKDEKERVRRYRKYMYHAGSVDRPDTGKVKVIDPRILKKEKRKEFKITQASRLRYRTRYFTDSGIIGSKEFVDNKYKEPVPKIPLFGNDYQTKRINNV